MTSAEAVKVMVGTKTLWPGPTPSASRPRCRAAVHELTAQANRAPTASANVCSSARAFPAVVSQPLSRTAFKYVSSFPSQQTLQNGIFRDVTGSVADCSTTQLLVPGQPAVGTGGAAR